MRYLGRCVVLLAALVFAPGCDDLDVQNLTDPDRSAALSEAVAVQNLIASSWVSVWSVSQSERGSAARIPGYADEGTANHRELIDYAAEPRQSFPNSQVGDARFLVEAPWYSAYVGAANAMDGLVAMDVNNLQMPTDAGAKTAAAANARARAFAWLNHGILYSYLAMIFDQASTAGPETDLSDPEQVEYRPFPEVRDFAINSLQKAIEVAQSAPEFVTPGSWMGGAAVNNAELVRLANSYIARLLVYSARNPAERAQVDWSRVITHIDAGIQSDHTAQMSAGGLSSTYLQYLMQLLAQRWAVDYRLIGPADVSGAYAKWVATPLLSREPFVVVTPDRRIAGAGGSTKPGKYITWSDEAIYSGSAESYLMSDYKFRRFDQGGDFPWQEGPNPLVTVAEMNLLKAEALLRTGDPAGAAQLINKTRVANGELPPVTPGGVPGDFSSCVPRTQDGTACGTLLDALHYERLIEGMGSDMWLAWFNRRGFGTLKAGTFEQLPVPARELESFGREVYTFGGAGAFAADANEGVQ